MNSFDHYSNHMVVSEYAALVQMVHENVESLMDEIWCVLTTW